MELCASSFRSIVVVRSLRKRKVASSILAGGFEKALIFSAHYKR